MCIRDRLGASVRVFDSNAERMAYIDDISNGVIHTIYNNEYNLRQALKTADPVSYTHLEYPITLIDIYLFIKRRCYQNLQKKMILKL